MRHCKVEWCDSKHRSKGFCGRHYQQMKTYGKIIPTRFDPPQIIKIDEKTIGIVLRDNKGMQKAVALVDADKRSVVENHKWYVNDEGYVGTNVNGTTKKLHTFLTNHCGMVDHKNRNTLDNRSKNIRPCSHAQNMMNRGVFGKNKSGVTGVSFYKNRKWQASIRNEGVLKHLGYFKNKEDAIRARVHAEMKYFGEFAPQVEKYKHLIEGAIK